MAIQKLLFFFNIRIIKTEIIKDIIKHFDY